MIAEKLDGALLNKATLKSLTQLWTSALSACSDVSMKHSFSACYDFVIKSIGCVMFAQGHCGFSNI